jgi:hypothetical protein
MGSVHQLKNKSNVMPAETPMSCRHESSSLDVKLKPRAIMNSSKSSLSNCPLMIVRVGSSVVNERNVLHENANEPLVLVHFVENLLY